MDQEHAPSNQCEECLSVNSSYSGVNFLPIAQLSSAIILEHWGASAQKLKTQFIEHY